MLQLKNFLPKVKISEKETRITKGILKSFAKNDRIYRKSIRAKNAAKMRNWVTLGKSYRNVLNKIARLSKANHYKDILEYNKNKLINFGWVSKRL